MAQEQATPEKQVMLQKVYLKDFSFESPKVPEAFSSDLDAETLFNIRSSNRTVGPEDVEVTLTLAVKAVARDETVFAIEIVQAGVFTIRGYTPEERFTLLGTFCPDTLYPFARETIAVVANKGGFPNLLLRPLDFNALYAQNMQEWTAQAAQAEPAQT